MDYNWNNKYNSELINGIPAWEYSAKKNNPNFKKISKFFFAPKANNKELEGIQGGCLVPIDTEEGWSYFSNATPIPFELVDAWIETHPNQRFYNNELLKTIIEDNFVSEEYLSLLKERNLIVEIPENEEYKNKMF